MGGVESAESSLEELDMDKVEISGWCCNVDLWLR